MNKKLLSVILALVMVLGAFVPVFAEEAETTEAPVAPVAMEKHIEFLKDQKIIEGDKTGDLMLDRNIDRASFAAILVRAAGKEATAEAVKTLPGRFKDMNAAHWANGYATVAHDMNLMKGNTAGEFMPGKEISYAEIATTLVRFLGKEQPGFVWPTSYIAKATELGLFEGVEIGGMYNSSANRNHVFKMLYNALSKEDFGKYNVYKVIVLENDRVATIKGNEVKAEVLSVVQIANNVSTRGIAKVGQQMILNLEGVKVEGGLADTENLLGKVVDVTIDENGKLVKAVVDKKNYEYYYGDFAASKDGKKLVVNGMEFNVRVDERYYDSARPEKDDRVYRTYLTSGYRAKNFNYITFAERLNLENNHPDKIEANLARVTVKDGMVLFVDAYNYTDIAPVKEVAREGKDVFYWNDARNATVERMTPSGRVIGYTAKDGFKNIDKKDIKADDVIHWMDGFTLVRQDAVVKGNLVRTYENRAGEFGELKLGEDNNEVYYLRSDKYERAPLNSVFAYDDQHYQTLHKRAQINNMVGSDVKALLDVFGDFQLVTSHEKFTDRLALVNKNVSSRGMEFYAPNAPEETRFKLNDDWDSNYYRANVWNGQQTNRFDSFRRLDLAYTEADSEGSARIVAAIDGFLYDGDKYNGHAWAPAKFVEARRDFVRLGSEDEYKDVRYDSETDVFVINKDANGRRVVVVEKVTMADVKKYNMANADLEAVVLTEKEYAEFLAKINVETWGRYNDARENFAKAIIFTNYAGPQADLARPEIGRIVRIDNWSNRVQIEVTRGVFEEFVIHKSSAVNMKTVGKVGEFVEFRRVKDSDPQAARFDKIITATDSGLVSRRTANTITVNGTVYNTDNNTKEFGDSRYNYAWVYVVGGYADLIVFVPSTAPVEVGLAGLIAEAEALLPGASNDVAGELKAAIRKAKEARTDVDKLLAEKALKEAIAKAKKEKVEAVKPVLEETKKALKAEITTLTALLDGEALKFEEDKKDEAVKAAKKAVKNAKEVLNAEGKKIETLKAVVGEDVEEYKNAVNALAELKATIEAVEKAIKAVK